jgi:hypothetical protein
MDGSRCCDQLCCAPCCFIVSLGVCVHPSGQSSLSSASCVAPRFVFVAATAFRACSTKLPFSLFAHFNVPGPGLFARSRRLGKLGRWPCAHRPVYAGRRIATPYITPSYRRPHPRPGTPAAAICRASSLCRFMIFAVHQVPLLCIPVLSLVIAATSGLLGTSPSVFANPYRGTSITNAVSPAREFSCCRLRP